MNTKLLHLTLLSIATALVGCASQPMSKGNMGRMSCSCENCKMMSDAHAEKQGGMGMTKMGMMGAPEKGPTTTAPANEQQDHTAHHGG